MDVESDKDGLHTFSDFPPSAVDEENEDEPDDTDNLIKTKTKSVWTFAYYQELFDVDTSTVLNRVKGSMIPLPSHNFSRSYVKGKPDMYGPFWICATLVVCYGVCGNLTSLFHNSSNPDYTYHTNFQLLPIAAVIIYSYVFIMPLIVKTLFWWRKIAPGLSLTNIICIYGYSLFVFIPASILFIVPVEVFDWIVLSIAVCLSGIVVIISLWPGFENESKKLAVIILFILLGIHVTMMVILRLYFFAPVFVPGIVNRTEISFMVTQAPTADVQNIKIE